MDEILIDDKKYVSSKRAAKMTGYAKDYIGQLCREGRVPARLVGRSWYVLETAIQDHRFGPKDAVPELEPVKLPVKKPTLTFSQNWESPRYEASTDEPLPSINRSSTAPTSPAPVELQSNQNEGQPQGIEDSWRAWFDHIANNEPVISPRQEEQINPSELEEREEGVNIPVHPIYELPPEELLPQHQAVQVVQNEEAVQEEEESEINQEPRSRTGFFRAISVIGVIFALFVAALATIGTGYFDKYITSIDELDMISGVILYNK